MESGASRPRGQQPGAKAHGRRQHRHLPVIIEEARELAAGEDCCPQCQKPFKSLPPYANIPVACKTNSVLLEIIPVLSCSVDGISQYTFRIISIALPIALNLRFQFKPFIKGIPAQMIHSGDHFAGQTDSVLS